MEGAAMNPIRPGFESAVVVVEQAPATGESPGGQAEYTGGNAARREAKSQASPEGADVAAVHSQDVENMRRLTHAYDAMKRIQDRLSQVVLNPKSVTLASGGPSPPSSEERSGLDHKKAVELTEKIKAQLDLGVLAVSSIRAESITRLLMAQGETGSLRPRIGW